MMADQWRHVSDVVADAYVDWVRGAARWVVDPADDACAVPVLVSLKPGTTERDFMIAFEQVLRQQPRGIVTEFAEMNGSRESHPDPESSQFTLTLPPKALALLHSEPSVARLIHRVAVAHELPGHARCKGGAQAGRPVRGTQRSVEESALREPESGTVVMGIIDEGLAFANQRFRRGPDDSRVEYAWIQDGRCSGAGQVPYGRELKKADIDTLLVDCTSAGQVDEDLFYSRSGVVDFGLPGHKAAARRAGHGTHVMDLACGYDQGASPSSGGRDQRPIVCVKLPTVTVADTSGIGLEYYVVDGIDYILRKAHDIAQQRGCGALPVVINFSSGILAGPRDGTHPIELAIDDRIRRRAAPTDVVLPAGNSRLSRLHAKISVPRGEGRNGGERELQFRVLPDDGTCSYLEIWLPPLPEAPAEDWMELTLQPPGGQTSLPLVAGAGKRAIEWAPHGDVLCKVYYEFIGPPTNRGRYMIALLPTALHAFHGSARQLAPCGTWTIRLKNRTRATIPDVEASIQWDDRPLGYPQIGRQSYFIDHRYERFDEISGREVDVDNASTIRRDGSLNAIATGARTVVAGGYLRKEKRVVDYSSGGPISPTSGSGTVPHRRGPDGLARSDDSQVHQGVLAAGTRSGSVVVMNGTSVAAPQIARRIAEERAAGDTRPGREIVEGLGRPPEPDCPAGAGHRDGAGQTSVERVGSGLVVTPRIERVDRLYVD
jgi:hypothetical protein